MIRVRFGLLNHIIVLVIEFYFNIFFWIGGRFKKLYFSHSQPQLLLIRDEAGAPDIQLASWADALVVVISLADTESIRIASEYYAMFRGLRDKLDIPTMLIATQGKLPA